MRKTSVDGICLILSWEQLRLVQYKDSAGYPTIGWGHRIKKGERFPREITRAQANAIFRDDLADAEASATRLCGPRVEQLTQGQFDALVSFVFNLGETKIRNGVGTFGAIRDGRWEDVPEWMSKWTGGGPGLVERRAEEVALWRS